MGGHEFACRPMVVAADLLCHNYCDDGESGAPKTAGGKSNSMKKNFQFLLSVFTVAVVVVIVAFSQSRADVGGQKLRLYFLDVGQGDSAYIKNSDGTDILIDGGPDDTILTKLGKIMAFGDREINLVILTHPHADHLDGLVEVLKRYQVDEIWQSGVNHSTAAYAEFKNLISQKQIKNEFVQNGATKNFGPVKILVLYPLLDLKNQDIDNVNNASVVSRLEYNQFSALFTGDAEKEVQQQILAQTQKATVLKVAHHGSKDALNEDFLAVVRPAVAIISAGKNNKFGHPHAPTVEALKRLAIQIYRTDQNGTIEISSDGVGYQVKSSY